MPKNRENRKSIKFKQNVCVLPEMEWGLSMVFRQRGLTLIELMVTIAVLAILISIAVPSFTTMIRNNSSLALGEELVVALNYARSEAVKRGARVALCGSADGLNCGGSWSDSWLVVVDGASSDTANAVSVDSVLRQWQPRGTGATVTAKQGGNAPTFIRFNRLGLLANSTNGKVTLNASVSGCSGTTGREVTVGVAGIVNVTRSSSGCS